MLGAQLVFGQFTHKAAAIATAHGMNKVFVAQRVQGFADGDVRHPHQFGQFCLVGQLFIGFEQACYDGIFEAINHLF